VFDYLTKKLMLKVSGFTTPFMGMHVNLRAPLCTNCCAAADTHCQDSGGVRVDPALSCCCVVCLAVPADCAHQAECFG
jgi:hypothetical protein